MARGDTLLLLNADTVASQDLSPLIRLANAPLVGSAGCRLRYRDGRIQPSFGYSHSPIATLLTWCGMGRVKGIPRSLRRLETRSQEYLLDHDDVGWVSGACMATRREVWDRIGGLDERYFMYCEDVDYCLKVSDAGLRVAYTASTEVVHLEAGGEPWVGRVALLHTLRSYQVFFGDRSTELGLRLLFFGLAALFIARSFAARLLSIAGWRSASCAAMNASKAAAYCEAASAALRVATLGREPFGFD
jgi:GT2 family glycosyltransferase